MPFKSPFQEWLSIVLAKYVCQKDIWRGSYTAVLWLRDRSHLRKSCLPDDVKPCR